MNFDKTDMPTSFRIKVDHIGYETHHWFVYRYVKKRQQKRIKPAAIYRMLEKEANEKLNMWYRLSYEN